MAPRRTHADHIGQPLLPHHTHLRLSHLHLHVLRILASERHHQHINFIATRGPVQDDTSGRLRTPVDKGLGSSGGWWAPTVATYCPTAQTG